MSPGAGLQDAEAQAEAAFADMINTNVDLTGKTLNDEDLSELSNGGRMDAQSTSKKSAGFFGDVKDLFGVGPGTCYPPRHRHASEPPFLELCGIL